MAKPNKKWQVNREVSHTRDHCHLVAGGTEGRDSAAKVQALWGSRVEAGTMRRAVCRSQAPRPRD